MPRTFRLSAERRAMNLGGCGLLVAMFAFFYVRGSHWPEAGRVLALVLGSIGLLLGIASLLENHFVRIVATEEGIESYDFLNRLSFSVPYAELTEYRHLDFDVWRLMAGEKKYRLPRIQFDEFHRLIVARAPKALRAKRWRSGQVPSPKEIKLSCLLDGRSWLSLAAFDLVFLTLFVSMGSLYAFAILVRLWPRIFDLKDVSGKLSMDSDSVTATWPWDVRSIRWTEVKAVFRVQRAGRRCFVVTSKDVSIFIPAHMAVDLEVMRKFFYSLPQGTLCVNFSINDRKGYRHRRRKRSLVPRLEPAGALDSQF